MKIISGTFSGGRSVVQTGTLSAKMREVATMMTTCILATISRREKRFALTGLIHFTLRGDKGVNYAASKKITVEKYDAVDFLKNEFSPLIVILAMKN